MKKILSLSAALLMVVTVIAQNKREAALTKYFAAVSYGVGSATWYSDIKNSILYDKSGTVLKSGNIKFTAKNPSSAWNFQVSFPVKNVRLGMGISFEEFYLDKIVMKSGNTTTDGNLLLFDESFRFDKFYATVEVPFVPASTKNYSFSATGNLGYYNYTGIERFNFFGEEPLAKMYLANVGLLADYKVFSHTYVFINPTFEFKYFQNNRFESPSDINHKILTYSIAGGIRVDVSKE